MAAGLGFKTFTTGEVLTAADTNGYLMQGILVFADAAARDAAITSPEEGNACYLKDTNEVLTYSGSVWVAVGGSSGLTLINTTSFSAVASQNINSIFSSAYQNYIVYLQATISTATAIRVRMRNGGTNATTNYAVQRFSSNNTTNTGDRNADTSSFNVMLNSADAVSGVLTFFRPFESAATGLISEISGMDGTTAYILKGSGAHTTASSQDGLSFFPGSGTFTGIIRIYGVQN